MRNVIAEPATQIGRGCVERVVNVVEDDGEAGGAGHAVLVGEPFGCVKNQASVGAIGGAENADAEEKFAEGRGKSLQAGEKRLIFFGGDGAFADEEPETAYGD